MIEVGFVKLHDDAIAPRQAHPTEDAGWDLFALRDTWVPTWSGEGKLPLTWIHTGIAVALPTSYYGRIVGRSSAASKGLHVIEGVIDSGYRGEQLMRVCSLWMPEKEHWPEHAHGRRLIKRGESLAQLIVQEIRPVRFVEVAELAKSKRGDNGFGSSG